MKRLIGWVFGLTKVGKAVESFRGTLAGYKSYIFGAALAVPALLKIIVGFIDGGSPYLLNVSDTEDYRLLMEGLSIMGLRAAISKAL